MDKELELSLKKAERNITKNVETELNKKVERKEKELKKEVDEIQSQQKIRQEDINKKKSEEFTELTYDIVFDLMNVADEILDNISRGRVGQNLNFKLMQLYNRVVEYRKKMVKGLAMVKNEDRLDAIQIRKDLKRNFNSNSVKIRSKKTKKRLTDF